MKRFLILTIYILLSSTNAFSQFIVLGDAQNLGGDCYLLTDSINNQNGQIWSSQLFNLQNRFEIYAQVNLGSKSSGGDGLAFLFQQAGGAASSAGVGNLGFNGITPSFGFELDTDQNTNKNDPNFDHIALFSNGNTNHTSTNNLIGPTGILTNQTSLKDGNDHLLHVLWDPAISNFKVWVDCDLRLNFTGNIVTMFMGGDPNVLWGFTAGTSNNNNRQQVCIEYIDQGSLLADTTTCAGDTIQLDAGYGSQYQWSTQVGISDSTIATPGAFPLSTAQYTVTITDQCGATRTDSYLHTVLDSNIFELFGDTVTCPGQNIPLNFDLKGIAPFNLTLSSTTSGTTNHILDASGNDMNTGLPITVSPNSNTTYSITAFSGTSVCNNSFSGTMNVITDILNNMTTTQVDATCFDSCNASVTFHLPHITPNYSFNWGNVTHDTTKQNLCAGNYIVTVSNGVGCTTTTPIAINEPTAVTVAPMPNTTACINEVKTITATAAGGYPPYTYLWSNGVTQASINIGVPQDSTINVIAFDANGCPSAPQTATIDVLKALRLKLTNNTGFCVGDSVLLIAQGQGSTGNFNYNWSTGEINDTIVAQPDSTSTYYVTITDDCGSPAIQDSVLVTIEQMPSDSLHIAPLVCEGKEVTFNFHNYNKNYTHYLNIGLGDSLEVSKLYNHTYTATGCYDITVNIIGRFCQKRWTDTCGVEVFSTPTAGFTYSPDEPTLISEYQFTVADSSFNATQWVYVFNEDTVAYTPNFVYNLPDSGSYEIIQTVKNTDGCSDEARDTITVEHESPAFFLPNAFSPNNDGLNDGYGAVLFVRGVTAYRFQIFSRFGNLVFDSEDPLELWNGTEFNTGNDASQGLYIYRISFVDEFQNSYLQKGNVLLFR